MKGSDLALCVRAECLDSDPCCRLHCGSQQCLLNILSHSKFSWRNQTLISAQPAKSHLMSCRSCSVSLAELQAQSHGEPDDRLGDGEAGAGMVNKEGGSRWVAHTQCIIFYCIQFTGFSTFSFSVHP